MYQNKPLDLSTKNVQKEPLDLSVNRRERSISPFSIDEMNIIENLIKEAMDFLPAQEVERLIDSVEQEPLNLEMEHEMAHDLSCNKNAGMSRPAMETVEDNAEEPLDDQQHLDFMRYQREIELANQKNNLKEIATDRESLSITVNPEKAKIGKRK